MSFPCTCGGKKWDNDGEGQVEVVGWLVGWFPDRVAGWRGATNDDGGNRSDAQHNDDHDDDDNDDDDDDDDDADLCQERVCVYAYAYAVFGPLPWRVSFEQSLHIGGHLSGIRYLHVRCGSNQQ